MISRRGYPKWISPAGWVLVADLATDQTGETLTKSAREIMEIFESYDLTRCAHSAARLSRGRLLEGEAHHLRVRPKIDVSLAIAQLDIR